MNAKDLIEGKRYVIKRSNKPVGVYEGKHGGRLDLADGSAFYGGDNLLRFTVTDENGTKQTLLLNSGADVDEPEDVRIEREARDAAREARIENAYVEATELLARLGFQVIDGHGYQVKEPSQIAVRRGYSSAENADDIEVEMTIGKLKLAIERGQPIAAR